MRFNRFAAIAAVGAPRQRLTACGGDRFRRGRRAPRAVRSRSRPRTPPGVAKNSADAGTSVFNVTNGGNKVTEFYVYAPGDRVMGEVENIAPGLSRDCTSSCPPGRTRRPASPA